MIIDVLRPGLLTTLQDRGRHGCAMLGVGRAGAMDDVALRLANALVGNEPDAAVLEITLIGPRLRFGKAVTIALTGAEFPARIGHYEVPMWQPIAIKAGSELEIGTARRGTRAYLAIAGGFAAEPVLGSLSTDVNARLGGVEGRPLRENDRLRVDLRDDQEMRAEKQRASFRGTTSTRWSLDPRPWLDTDTASPIRLMRGRHFDALEAACAHCIVRGRVSHRVGFEPRRFSPRRPAS